MIHLSSRQEVFIYDRDALGSWSRAKKAGERGKNEGEILEKAATKKATLVGTVLPPTFSCFAPLRYM